MLKFIQRFQLDRKNIKPLPKQLKQVQSLLHSEMGDNWYKIIKGDKRSQFLVVNYHSLDEFDNPTIDPCPSLSSACSEVYHLIRANHPELIKTDFRAIEKAIAAFSKKYNKLLTDVLFNLCELEPNLGVNWNLVTLKESQTYFKTSQSEDNYFAFIIHDGSLIYDFLSYQATGSSTSELTKYLEQYFELEAHKSWATALRLKEPVLSPQEKWNKSNPEVNRASSAKYNQKNPVLSFVPTQSNLDLLEKLRLKDESTQSLLNRILASSPETA